MTEMELTRRSEATGKKENLWRKHQGWWDRKLTPGEFGCSRSHHEVWQWAAKQPQLEWLCIFEDDTIVQKRTVKFIESLLGKPRLVQAKPDIVYLGRCEGNPMGDVSDKKEDVVMKKQECPGRRFSMKTPCGASWTGALVLSRAGFTKLANSGFEHSLFNVDDFLNAVHGTHARLDEMGKLECVKKVRSEGWTALVCEPCLVNPVFKYSNVTPDVPYD
ncbi:MAG: hypothetical protein GY703_12105 [Gammaproteobacteria bacterium]|nr:hypothetical protein [Gammaproteobacteria bacterium]